MSAAEEEGRVPFNGFDGQAIEWADVPEPLSEIKWTENTYADISFPLKIRIDELPT